MLRIDDGCLPPRVHTDPVPSDPTPHGTTQQNVAPATQANSPPKTPAQIVDLAVANYKAAVASGNQDAIKKARQDVYTAVRNEIGPQVDAANRYIPAEFQTPASDQITSYGNIILRRNSSDAVAQGVLKERATAAGGREDRCCRLVYGRHSARYSGSADTDQE